MKKNIPLTMSSWLCFLLTCLQLTTQAQPPTEKTLSAAELKEWNNTPLMDNPLAKISASEKAQARDKAQAMVSYVVKAVLNRADPSTYPIDAKDNSLQATAVASIRDVSAYTFNKLRDRVNVLMTDASKRSTILGKFRDIDFKKKTIHTDVKKIVPLEVRPAVNMRDDASLQPLEGNYRTGLGGTNGEKSPAYSKLDLVMRAVHCVDETNPESPGDDDMIVGGLIIGCSGNTKKATSTVSCHFDDGDYCDHGAIPFGTYNLGSCNGYPKTFYAIIQLIEADSDEKEAADALSEVMAIAAAALASTGYGAALAAVAAAVEVFSSLFFDDDAFHPYGIALTLSNQNAFGADGRSNNFATGNISDHDGTYRVGFYWRLKN